MEQLKVAYTLFTEAGNTVAAERTQQLINSLVTDGLVEGQEHIPPYLRAAMHINENFLPQFSPDHTIGMLLAKRNSLGVDRLPAELHKKWHDWIDTLHPRVKNTITRSLSTVVRRNIMDEVFQELYLVDTIIADLSRGVEYIIPLHEPGTVQKEFLDTAFKVKPEKDEASSEE